MIDSLRNSIAKLRDWRFARFIVFGIVNTIFGYAVYALFLVAGLEPQLALALSYPVGIVWNYFTTARFVFRQQGFRNFPVYVLCYVAIYGVNSGGLQILLVAALSPLLAQAVMVPFVAVIAFILMSYAFASNAAHRK